MNRLKLMGMNSMKQWWAKRREARAAKAAAEKAFIERLELPPEAKKLVPDDGIWIRPGR